MKFENVIVFGLGAVGSNVLLNLVRDLPDLNYIVVDFDKVEERNYRVGTQPYLSQHKGKYKTQSIQMLCQMQANKRVEIFTQKIEDVSDILNAAYNNINKTHLFIDAFDKAEYRNLFGQLYIDIKKEKSLKNINTIHIGFSPIKTGSIIWDNMWTDITDTKSHIDICTMQGARSFIMSLTSIASDAIVKFYNEDIKTNLFYDSVHFNLKELK